MKVLLLSAYAARSHVHWQHTLQAMFKHWQWAVLSLPPRHFSWRIRGNALYWSIAERAVLEEDYDLLVATSMVDIATLRGLVPALTRVPTVLYFHENQFEYPQYRQQHSLLESRITSIYSALASDFLLFNSNYNRDSFLAGVAGLLQQMPDRVPPGLVSLFEGKSEVLAVPINHCHFESADPRWPTIQPITVGRKLRLVWVGRFEHDKGGEGLLRILRGLDQAGVEFELAVIGQQFRHAPPVFTEIESAYRQRLVQFGYVEGVENYRSLLRGADIVLSTALHEFQGLAVMEAVANGCYPIVPDRLAYPETYPARCRYESRPDAPEQEAIAAAALIAAVSAELHHQQVPDVSSCSVQYLAPRYERVFRNTIAAQDSQ